MSASAQSGTEFTIKVRYYDRRTVLPDHPVPASGFRGYVEKPLSLRTDNTVIGCMHVMNIGYPSSEGGLEWTPESPAWRIYRSVESVARMRQIVDEHIAPLIDEARRVGLRVMHMQGGIKAAERYPQWQEIAARLNETPGKPDPVAAQPAPPKGSNPGWKQEFRRDVFGPDQCEIDKQMEDLFDIAPPIKPAPQDWVITTNLQARTILGEHGIGNILYTGFDTGGCVMSAPGGLRSISKYGYRPIVLRDCTTNGEIAETVETLEVTRAALSQIETFRGYTSLGDALRLTLENLQPTRVVHL